MAESKERAWSQRRRRANVEGGRRAEHRVKVSAEEEGALLRLANERGITVPRLLVEAALSGERSETHTERQNLIAMFFQLHRLLANVANNVNQIARATNATRESQPETFDTLDDVRRVAMRLDELIDEMSAS